MERSCFKAEGASVMTTPRLSSSLIAFEDPRLLKCCWNSFFLWRSLWRSLQNSISRIPLPVLTAIGISWVHEFNIARSFLPRSAQSSVRSATTIGSTDIQSKFPLGTQISPSHLYPLRIVAAALPWARPGTSQSYWRSSPLRLRRRS